MNRQSPCNETAALTRDALDPARSVVVEACAGSGKTWLLASRIVRLLLAGVAPGEILAITFTRKAAREIEARVIGWLRQLAMEEDAAIDNFLAERGLVADTADPTLRQAVRGLYERVLAAQPGLAVNTFHAWFLQLVDAAPLSANLAGVSLIEPGVRQFDELWRAFIATLPGEPAQRVSDDVDPAPALVRLLETAGLEAVRRLIHRAYERRSEWLALAEADGDSTTPAARVVSSLQALLGVGAPGEALAAFFADGWPGDWQAYLGLLEKSELKGDRASAAAVRAALAEADADARFTLLRAAMLNKDGSIPVKKAGAALDKRYTPAGARRFLALHAALCQRLVDCGERRLAEHILAFNRDACVVFTAFLAHAEAIKQGRRQIDFVDAEWRVLQLLRAPETSAFLQARLDARYRHVLLDEFQDTNPLQWQILRAWLDAYSDDWRPRIFLVGDPKQSIYRFRRAEPRLFGIAADFLVRAYGALRCTLDATRRNAQPVVDAVNAVFLGLSEFAPFRAQTTFAEGIPGRVELLPLFGADAGGPAGEAEAGSAADAAANTAAADAGKARVDGHLRDPLTEAAQETEDLRQIREAEALAKKIGEIVGHAGGGAWQLHDSDRIGGGPRPARYGDILLLVRTRSKLAVYERALSAAGIPYEAASRGGLLATLEASDIAALLEFLAMPLDNLKLAHVLRSPIFACSNEELLLLAFPQILPPLSSNAAPQSTPDSWWRRLAELTAGGQAPPRLLRAARLLASWLRIAGDLPTHDLLDRIYHEGEVFARYRRASPEYRAAAVEANLNALLLLALDLDGGRYPSLSRFVDELRNLREADAGDAPDEGEVVSAQTVSNRVRILTIHAAKGLEAPIVWLLDANATARPAEPWDVIVDWPPEEASPRHFSFFGRKDARGAARRFLFDAQAQAAQREELNLLYVAMTRARQVFIASGSEQGRKSDSPQSEEKSAYRLLKHALESVQTLPVEPGSTLVHGDDLTGAASVDAETCTVAMPAPAQAVPPTAAPAFTAVGSLRPASDDAARFGTLLHALLERLADDGHIDRLEAFAHWRIPGFDEETHRRAWPVVRRLLSAPALRVFFDPARYRRAWNEIELADRDGRLLRIDRLVELDDALWVLDYKSSSGETARLDAYREQVRGYCRALADIFPDRTIRGALVFADAELLEIE